MADEHNNDQSEQAHDGDVSPVIPACVSETAISRRRAILGSTMLGIGVLGVSFRKDLGSAMRYLARSRDDSHVDAQKKQPARAHNPIPNTASVKAYRKFLQQHPLQYLSPNELLRPHFKTRAGICSGIPPEHLWRNMVATTRVADEIRRRLGVSLHTVTSAYRSPQYNAKCPGASKYSQHMRNCALDLVYSCPPRKVFEVADQLRKEGFFKGGVGLYSNFVHIDTRGRNATWGV